MFQILTLKNDLHINNVFMLLNSNYIKIQNKNFRQKNPLVGNYQGI